MKIHTNNDIYNDHIHLMEFFEGLSRQVRGKMEITPRFLGDRTEIARFEFKKSSSRFHRCRFSMIALGV